ncbi:MAG: DegV family protein, partial [Carbonactinosporaceae bacterium]
MPVTVIVDSAASLPPEAAVEWGIAVVPMALSVRGRSYRDGEVSEQELLAAPPDQVHTSGPSPGDFLTRFEACPAGAVVITVAGAVSSTYRAACLAAESTKVPVRVVDSATAAGGEALVAIAAARRA